MEEIKESNSVGRPTVMTPEVIAKLEEAFSNGATDLEACFLANISKDALYYYQKDHPEFTERKEALKDMTKYQAKKNIREAIISGDKETSKWYVERKIKEEFSLRNELTGKDGNELAPQPVLVKFIGSDDTRTSDNRDTGRV